MAAKYRKLDPRIWSDEKFQQMTPMQKLVAIYVLTGQVNRIGIFKFSVGLAAEDIGYPPDTLRDTLQEVCNTLGWHYDSVTRVLYLPNWWRYNATGSELTMKGAIDDLHEVPQSHLVQDFLSNKTWLNEQEGRVLDTLVQGYAKGIGKGMGKGPPIPVTVTVAVTGTVTGENIPGSGEPAHTQTKTRKTKKTRAAYPPDFESFWKAYPRRNGAASGEKSEAYLAWIAMTDEDQQLATKALPNYIGNLGDRFPKDACRYLKHSIFMDHLEADPDRPLTEEEIQAELSRQVNQYFDRD